jgi:hypothetical protein
MPTTPSSTEHFDDLRASHPELGFALYAIEPGRPVTLEIYTPDGGVFPFVGASAREAIETAFPPQPPETVFD